MALYKCKIRTKNYSADPLKGRISLPFRSIVRLGSTTETEIVFPKSFKAGKTIIECNSVESIHNSRSKLLMKECFNKAGIPQANGLNINEVIAQDQLETLSYPLVAKRVYGFKGHGMRKLDNQEQLEDWIGDHESLDGWYFEEFKNYSKEYRLHCTQTECFMSWRKLRKSEATERWFFNSSNCNWVSNAHELFDQPVNWEEIITQSINAVKAVGLDIGAVDVRVQSSTNSEGSVRKSPKFIILEVNSAPALGEQGIEAYHEAIINVLTNKFNSHA